MNDVHNIHIPPDTPGAFEYRIPHTGAPQMKDIHNIHIQPSEKNREFTTGAVRGDDTGKGHPVLIPWEAVRLVAPLFGGLTRLPWRSITALAKVYEAGAKKAGYGPRNWEKGMPLSAFANSAKRHFTAFILRQEDEPHAVQYLWNLLGMLQMQIWISREQRPAELNDLPGVKLEGFYLAGFSGGRIMADTLDAHAEKSFLELTHSLEGDKTALCFAIGHAFALVDRHLIAEGERRWVRNSWSQPADKGKEWKQPRIIPIRTPLEPAECCQPAQNCVPPLFFLDFYDYSFPRTARTIAEMTGHGMTMVEQAERDYLAKGLLIATQRGYVRTPPSQATQDAAELAADAAFATLDQQFTNPSAGAKGSA